MFPPLTKGKKMISTVLSSCSRASALAGTVVLLCVPATTNAETVQYWVKGVTEQSGWTNTFQFYNGCWAASSSDMVNWWQNRISEKYKYPEDKRVSAEDFNRELEKRYGRYGNYAGNAIDYFLETRFPSLARPSSRYLYDNDTDEYRIHFARGWLGSKIDKVSDCLLKYFTGGDYIASIHGTNHAWTLWGMEVDKDTRKILSLYATDSVPDNQKRPEQKLHKFTVGYYGELIAFQRWMEDPEGGSTSTQVINPEEITFFGIRDEYLVDKDGKPVFSPLIPEPSVFGLLAGTAALALAGMRRRKRNTTRQP